MKNNMKKYINKIGQNTGTSKIEKNVMIMDVSVPFEQLNQNLNSGIRLTNGLYSSFVVGNDGPSFGSSNGERNAIKLFSRYIPRPYATMK